MQQSNVKKFWIIYWRVHILSLTIWFPIFPWKYNKRKSLCLMIEFFYLLPGYPTANFGPLSRRQPHKKLISNKNNFIDQINIINNHNSNLNCNKHSEPKELTNLAIDHTKCLSLLRFNISSVPFDSDEFSIFLTENRLHSDILGISKSHLKSEKIPITSTHLPEYNIEHTSWGQLRWYIANIKKVSITN